MGLLVIALLAFAISVILGKKIEETLAPAFMLVMLIVYLPGRFMKLTGGLILALLFAGGVFLFSLFILITKKVQVKELIFTPGGLALLIYTAFFAYYSFHRDFSHPDELYCWGLMAKNIYYYDTISSPLSTAMSADQTPLMPMLDYFFAKIQGSFGDSICYFAQDMFTISLLASVFARIKSKIKPAGFLLFAATLPSLMVISGLEAFKYILGDMVIAALLCFFIQQILAFASTADRFYYFAGMLSLMSMCLTKRLGPVFAGCAIFIAVPLLLSRKKEYIRELAILMAAVSVITVTWFGISVYDLIPLAALIGGVILYALFGYMDTISDRYHDAVCIAVVLGVVGIVFGGLAFGPGRDGYGSAVLARFMRDLFSVKTEGGFITLSYGFFILICFGMVLILRKLKNNGSLTRQDGEFDALSDCFVWTGLAMTVFAIFMLIIHIWQIGPMNGNLEGIIPRYIIPWEIFAAFLVIYTIFVEADLVHTGWMLLGFAVVVCISNTGDLYGQLFSKHRCIGYTAFSDAGIELQAGDLVYFIDEQNYFSYTDREFYYRAWPAKTNFIDQIFMGNNGRVKFDASELEQMIASDQYLEIPYDYVYLQTIDDDFAERYGTLFENVSDIAPGHAYKVILEGGNVMLRLL